MSSRLFSAVSVANAMFAPVMCAWRNRELLAVLIRRDIEARFRGTLLGTTWAGAVPLVKLGAYTLIFGLLIRPQWQDQIKDPFLIAFTYFLGLILFDFFTECIGVTANLMRDNLVFIKKVVFPVEILPWVTLGYATFRFLVGFSLLIISYLAFKGMPPADIILIPLLVGPLALIVLGLMWMLSALGTYVRDVGQIVTAFLPILMFISPIFFPLSATPDLFQTLLLINPLTFPIEQSRFILVGYGFHAWFGLTIYTVVALAIASLGYRFFMKLRPGFADVL